MSRASRAASLVAVILLVGGGFGAEDKEPPKGKGKLPIHWTKLGLSDSQKEKVHAVQGTYEEKLEDLQRQLAELKKKQRAELEAILTDEQKARLREIVLEKVPAADPPKEDKKP